MEYTFVVVEFPLVTVIGEKTYKDNYIGIGLKSIKNGLIYPLPITKFLEKYRNKNRSLNGQKNAAEAIKRFLNFCAEAANVSDSNPDFSCFANLKYQGIQGLKLEHGSTYITTLSYRCKNEDLNSSYVTTDIRYLIKFYYYLQKEGLIVKQFEPVYEEIEVIDIYDGMKQKRKKLIEIDIFEDESLGTGYPPTDSKKAKNNLKDFGTNRYQLVKEFIQIAEAIEPDIVPGLYLQFFGGLRRGEVVNITRDSIMHTEDGCIVDIDDRRNLLFPKKVKTDEEQVKYPRYQGVFWHRSMGYFFKKHEKWLDSLKEKGQLKNKYALLINRRTGQPITGSNYAEKFKRVKAKFFELLSDSGRLIDYNFLTAKPWGTHIGRGCFTNFCFDAGMTIGEVAVIRGDSNLNSVLDYIEEKVAVQTLRKAMNHIQNAFKDAEIIEDDTTKVNARLGNQYNNRMWNSYHG